MQAKNFSKLQCLIVMLVIANQARCSIDQGAKRHDVSQNYNRVGFLDPENFQIKCEVKNTLGVAESEKSIRSHFIEVCRNLLLIKVATYKIAYDDYLKKEAEKKLLSSDLTINKKDIKHRGHFPDLALSQIDLKLTNFQIKLIKNTYVDLLPGRLVYETRGVYSLSGVYRITKKNLIETIQKRNLLLQAK